MTKNYDAIIIGAGIIGAAIGYELSKKGRRTLNVEMLPAAGYGSTSNSCAIIRLYYSTLDGSAMAYDGYYYWREWADYLEAPKEEQLAQFIECGTLVMKTKLNDGLRKQLVFMDALNIPYEHRSNDQILENYPFYDLTSFAPAKSLDDPKFGEPTGGQLDGAIFFPNGGYISDPQFSTRNIQLAAERTGATFLFNSRVKEIPVNNGRVEGVVLSDGTCINAPVVINVAGPHSSLINALAGADVDMKISTRALRQEVAHVPVPKGIDYSAVACVTSDSDAAVYTRPEVGNNILIGSEDPPCDTHIYVDPDNYNSNFSNQWTLQAQRLGLRFPNLGIPSKLKGCVDLYDVTEDWIPIYDRSCVEGYFMACGTSGNQFKNAPVVGKVMAELIEYCESGSNHDEDPMLYQLKNIDQEISLATFSRLREINQNSSFSVLG
ncbi:MAG TPA: FAD-binding oxidoreductase [Deltaproteobacteria bacterium]|nr:FAD-binding oxidoreductase [Deltaproteobacteria bacterium]